MLAALVLHAILVDCVSTRAVPHEGAHRPSDPDMSDIKDRVVFFVVWLIGYGVGRWSEFSYWVKNFLSSWQPEIGWADRW